jgi:hypothetical protein
MGRGLAVVRSRYSSGRLTQAVPDCETLSALAFAQGESGGSQTTQLLKLLTCTVLPRSSEPAPPPRSTPGMSVSRARKNGSWPGMRRLGWAARLAASAICAAIRTDRVLTANIFNEVPACAANQIGHLQR